MAKAPELCVPIDPKLLERINREARRIDIRLPLLVEIALFQFLERTDNIAAVRREIGDTLAAQAVVNAKIEHLAGFVADVTAVPDAASSVRAGAGFGRREP